MTELNWCFTGYFLFGKKKKKSYELHTFAHIADLRRVTDTRLINLQVLSLNVFKNICPLSSVL